MKPVTGRPKNVTGVVTTVAGPTPLRLTRSDVEEPMPVVVALRPAKDRLAQPFWNVDGMPPVVSFTEPRTSEAALALVALRIDRTVDSQQSWPVVVPGTNGENVTGVFWV